MERDRIIQCGEDIFNVSDILLVDIENQSTYGLRFPPEPYQFNQNVSMKIQVVLNKYRHVISAKLPLPYPQYVDYKKSNYSVNTIDRSGEAEVVWEYYCHTSNNDVGILNRDTMILSLKNDIIPIVKQLSRSTPKSELQKEAIRKTLLFGFFADSKKSADVDIESISEMQKELSDIYHEYNNELRKVGKHILIIMLNGQYITKKYLQDDCDFDIFEKEREIKAKLYEYEREQEQREKERQKRANSNNRGEKDVDYHIKWILKSLDKKVLSIEGDCENQYRYNCIMLKNANFIDEAQEYDHILVSPAGIVIIETKDWKGSIDITPDGKWIRYHDENGTPYGSASPITQLRRHEQVMKSILPSVPVYSILCFSNPTAIVKGKENIKKYTIINVEQLEEELIKIVDTISAMEFCFICEK